MRGDPLGDIRTLMGMVERKEIVGLREILGRAQIARPTNGLLFVKYVNLLLEVTSHCVRLKPKGEVSRRLYVDRSGSLVFQSTRGSHRGFRKAEFEIIPYVRRRRPRRNVSRPDPAPSDQRMIDGPDL